MAETRIHLETGSDWRNRVSVVLDLPLVKWLLNWDAYPRLYLQSEWQPGTLGRNGRRLLAALVILLGVVGYVQGSRVFSAGEDTAQFYRYYFAPAINFTCSGRMSHYVIDADSQKFLNDEIEVFKSCDAVRAADSTSAWVPFDKQSTYLYFVTSVVWKVFGMSWDSLSVWAGFLTGLFAISVFLFLRVFSTSTVLAALMAGALLFTDIITKYLPEIRDFSKAPFLLLALALLGLAITRNFKPQTILTLYAAAGGCVAFGQGLRPDIAVVIPIVCVSTLLLLLRAHRSLNWRLPVFSLLTFAATYIVLSAPIQILAGMHAPVGTHSPHFFNLGYAETFFQNNLRMGSPSYEQFRFYHDSMAAEHSNAFAGDPELKRSSFGSPQYDKDGWENFFNTFTYFPHDAFMRPFYALRALMYRLPEYWWTTGAFGSLLISAGAFFNPRAAIYLILTAGALICISTLQFDERHFFHLITLFLALAALGVSSLGTMVSQITWKRKLHIDQLPIITFGAFLVFFLLGCAGLNAWLASTQSRNIDLLKVEYEARDWSPVEFSAGTDQIAIAIPEGASGLEMMKVSVATDDLGAEWSVLSLLKPVHPTTVSSSEFGLEVSMGPAHGYQVMSEPMNYIIPSDTDDDRMVKVFVDITVDVDQIVLGALTGDQQRWLGNAKVLNRGTFHGFLQFPIETDVADFILVIEKPGPESGKVTIRTLDVLPSRNICLPSEFQIGQNYDGGPGMAFAAAPEDFEEAGNTDYYFPAIFTPSLYLTSLSIAGTPTSCLKSVSWSRYDSGESKFELMIADEAFQGPRTRGRFDQILPLIFFGDQREREIEAWRRESHRVMQETLKAERAAAKSQ